jgi:hypothetical protein
VTLATACPKPEKVLKPRKYLPKPTRSLKRSWLKRGTKQIPQRNEKRIARKYASYRKVLASDFHKLLRLRAWARSGGLCECDLCRDIRSLTMSKAAVMADAGELQRAHTEVPVWFTNKGGDSWKRFRSTDGELHHRSYKYFGDENDAELGQVLWVWKSCHQRIEAEHGTRRRFLKGSR